MWYFMHQLGALLSNDRDHFSCTAVMWDGLVGLARTEECPQPVQANDGPEGGALLRPRSFRHGVVFRGFGGRAHVAGRSSVDSADWLSTFTVGGLGRSFQSRLRRAPPARSAAVTT